MESVLVSTGLTFQYVSPELRTPELEEKILAFKIKYFGAGGSRRFAEWKYRQGPIDCGDCEIIALAPDGSIVGHLGAVAFPSVPGCRLPRLALGTEFVVDEKYRGGTHDVIRTMDNMLGERLGEKGVAVVYGTPNKVGYMVAKRLYGRANGAPCVFLSKVFTHALAVPRGFLRKAVHRLLTLGNLSSPSLPAGWAWNTPPRFDPADVDGFCREFMRNLDYGVSRDAAFMNWRYGGGDGYVYANVRLTGKDGRVAGLAVLRINPARCEASALMEYMALDPAGYDALLGVCMRLARRSSPALIIYGVKESPAIEACLRSGFRPNSDILKAIGTALARVPAGWRARLVAKAENHFHVDEYTTLYNYPDPKRSKEFAQGRWYITLGEKSGF